MAWECWAECLLGTIDVRIASASNGGGMGISQQVKARVATKKSKLTLRRKFEPSTLALLAVKAARWIGSGEERTRPKEAAAEGWDVPLVWRLWWEATREVYYASRVKRA